MTVTAWHEEPIHRKHDRKHDREAFDCGEEALNEFLCRYARKSHELGGAKTFLAIDDADNKTILGFYSRSPASVDYARTPEIVRRGLARHDVPGFRLARLAGLQSLAIRCGMTCWRITPGPRTCLSVADTPRLWRFGPRFANSLHSCRRPPRPSQREHPAASGPFTALTNGLETPLGSSWPPPSKSRSDVPAAESVPRSSTASAEPE